MPLTLSCQRRNIAVVFTTDDVKSVAPQRLVLGKKMQHLRLETHDFQQLFPLHIFRILANNRVHLCPRTYGTLCITFEVDTNKFASGLHNTELQA
jgi:hypothetical protein